MLLPLREPANATGEDAGKPGRAKKTTHYQESTDARVASNVQRVPARAASLNYCNRTVLPKGLAMPRKSKHKEASQASDAAAMKKGRLPIDKIADGFVQNYCLDPKNHITKQDQDGINHLFRE